MKIVVTGGAGFIGSHVTQLLCDNGYDVRVIDDLSFGYKSFVDKRAKLYTFSLADISKYERVLDGVSVVMHLAASSIISTSFEHPLAYFENNVTNSVKLLESMRRKNVKKIIFSSSSSVYGQPKRTPIRESDPTHPLTIYGSSKLAFETILESYWHAFGIESVSLRYYNAYGPHDDQKPRTRAIPMWIEAILKGEQIPWYWQGRQRRDYVYVTDIARAHMAVMNCAGYNIFNVGSGKGILMKDVLRTLEKIAGKKFETKDLGERKGDPMKSYAHILKIKQAVGWEPKMTLEEGLRETFAYYKTNYETH